MMKKAATVTAARVAAAALTATAAVTVFAPAAVYAAEPVTAAETETTTAAPTRAHATTHLSDLDTKKESVEIPVEIVNNSGKRLVQLFIAPSDATSWGDDMMGQYYMNSGNSAWSSFTAYGNETVYDIYAVYADDTASVFTEFDFSDVPITGLTLELGANSASTSYVSR